MVSSILTKRIRRRNYNVTHMHSLYLILASCIDALIGAAAPDAKVTRPDVRRSWRVQTLVDVFIVNITPYYTTKSDEQHVGTHRACPKVEHQRQHSLNNGS